MDGLPHRSDAAKRAAASANSELEQIPSELAEAICGAVDELLATDFMPHFPVDVFQTGSGTSTNMNVNEVLATLASQRSGLDISPNDHVNMSQSSNDVIPTAIHSSAAIEISERLLPALATLQSVIEDKAEASKGLVKTGRTHLMDAMPIRPDQELMAWACQIEKSRERVADVQLQLCELSQGGTAVGSGINAPEAFASRFCEVLSAGTGQSFRPNRSFFEGLACQDTAVAASGQLRTLAVALMKISNDLRWMNSGPLSGLGEIKLKALQPGSSIMPGKVNPVVPEAVAMAAAQVIGNDGCVTVAGQSGNFQLNVMLPVIAYNLLQSISLMSNACEALAECIRDFEYQPQMLRAAVARNPVLVTALNPLIGYLKAAEIAKCAYDQGRDILDVAEEMTDYSRDALAEYLDPLKLTEGGVSQ